MKVKINEKLICIPPYLSTTWDTVAFLQTERDELTNELLFIVQLSNGKTVRIPHLDISIIEVAFSAHMKFLEGGPNRRDHTQKAPPVFQQLAGLSPDQIAGMPIRFGLQGFPGMDGIETAFQHNPQQSDIPVLPKEMIDKIASIAQTITGGDISNFPKPEPHCNCLHCQVAKAIHGMTAAEEENEEVVSAEDLSFRNWDIAQTGDKLFVVTNPLDPREQYNVFLGTPLGCTCGQSHCEHIKAVLST